jgi:acyl transferase domain-containing protein/acyl carrier protein
MGVLGIETHQLSDNQMHGSPQSYAEPIAIIGIGCRFPGEIKNTHDFWQLLNNKVDAITKVPPDRYDVDTLYDPTPRLPGKIVTREGGFVSEIDLFDPAFFNISPREAKYIDPQQRLLMEIAWEALEDSGQVAQNLAGSHTGVFIGMWTNEYEDRMYNAVDDINLYVTTGGGRYSASGRLSYLFDFQGPSLTLDTACSSSLVTVHLACHSIWRGESSMALAGGVNLLLEPQISIAYSRSGMLSPDGRCKFGDAKADGYVRSEGAGVVFLKPLSQAVADNDRIYALIRGSAVNNDGRSSGRLVAPGIDTQMTMLRQAYHEAGISPGEVGYIEAHGTGTKVGDPIELTAIGTVIRDNRPLNRPCLIGSVKTNIGHTEAASGIAGLIKAALILKHRTIPPSLHFNHPNPEIPWAELPLSVPQDITAWPEGYDTAVAGVNSFGVTGTNAHVVLTEYKLPTPSKDKAVQQPPYLLPISAKSPEALTSLALAYQELLSDKQVHNLGDICFTAAVRRTHLEYRLAVVAENRLDMAEQIAEWLQNDNQSRQSKLLLPTENHKVVFVFPGQGSQWIGMGRELMQREPLFRDVLTQCETAMQPFVDWSLRSQLAANPDDAHYRLDQIDVIQPTLLAIEIALAELWRAWGIQPDAVLGHSMGEVGAAYIADAITLEDAMRIICHRSLLMRRTSGQGAMAVVELTVAETEEWLHDFADSLSIAVSNSPRSTVISGDPEALDELLAALQAQEIYCRKVKVDVASHSPQMEPLQGELRAFLVDVMPRSGNIPIYATSQATISNGAEFNADFWTANLRQPVQFSRMVQQLLADEFTIFIEMSPHPILLPAVQQCCQHVAKEAVTIASLKRSEPEKAAILQGAGQLYEAGYVVDWSKLYPVGEFVDLPHYPWQRERFWYESAQKVEIHSNLLHPLLDSYVHTATGDHVWATKLNLSRFPYLADHRVGDAAIFPAAGFIEMILAAAQMAFPHETTILEQVAIREALPLFEDDLCQVQIIITPDMPGTAVFQFFSRTPDVAEWTLHVSGQVRLSAAAPDTLSLPLPGAESMPSELHYRAMTARNLPYGPAFRGVQQLWQVDRAVLGKLALPEAAAATAAAHLLPLALLDAAFQLLLATLPPGNETYLPVSVAQVWLNGRFTPDAAYRAYVVPQPEADDLLGDVFIFADEQLLCAAIGLQMRPLPEQKLDVADWMIAVEWQPQPLVERPLPTFDTPGQWLIFADAGGLGQQLADQLAALGEQTHLLSVDDLDAADPSAISQLLAGLSGERPLRGVLHLWGMGKTDPTDTHDLLSVVHLVQALGQRDSAPSPRLWLITCDAVSAASDVAGVAGASLWGLGRVIDHEHPDLACKRIDLTATLADADDVWAELWAEDGEREVALRPDGRFVSRLVPYTPQAEADVQVKTAVPGQPYRVAVTEPGILDNLMRQPLTRCQPGPGEVEIEVRATGLNFMNVMAVLGVLPGYDKGVGPLGIECAGVVTAAAADVTQFQVGDAVMGIAFNSLGSHAITDARLLVSKPDALSFVEAATMPIVFLTAYYALMRLGRLRAGERVLIHAGTGGVGQAAIQLAQHAGAEIFATAGTPEKRTYLHDQGISHVLDSRTLAFADEVLALTGGEGVDLLLNSLAGEAVVKGLEILRPYGRFLEIGKRDIYDNSHIGLFPFQKNLAYFAIDLDRMSRERPAEVGEMLRELVAMAEVGAIRPLPCRDFPVTEVSDAFRFMAQAKHIGKIVVTQDFQTTTAAVDQPADAGRATYLITGGLGALGLITARWLAEREPCDLVLLGRRPPTETAQTAIAELQQLGSRVVAMPADVTNRDDLQRVLAEIDATLSPLRGVVHAAGVLADSTLQQMDTARFRQALDPKVTGGWHLHTLTQERDLDFFVLFSSVTALLGTPGQGNYAAGNAFLDALAYHRRSNGLPALSINWGPWAEVGLAAVDANRGDRLALRGVGSITAAQGVAAMARLWDEPETQVAVMPFDLALWREFYAAARDTHLFDALAGEVEMVEGETAVSDIITQLKAAEPGRQRQTLLANHIRTQVAQVLRLTAERIPFNKPLKTLGIDSLMTLELRNRLETSLGLTLSATLIWNYPTIDALTPFLAEKLGVPLDADGDSVNANIDPFPSETQTDTLGELDDLSQADVEALLADELSEIDELLKGL